MNKIAFLAALLFFQLTSAQDSTPKPLELKKNEIKFDVISLIAMGKFHVSYERFLNDDFSVGISGVLAKSNKKEEDFEKGYDKTLPQYEVNPFVRYSLSKSKKSFYFIEAFVSVNGGKYRELERFVENGYGYWEATENNYTAFALGGALGYKLYIKEKIGIELFVGAGRNITNMEVSPEYVQRVGANIGYRF